jgi:hypothetical protein
MLERVHVELSRLLTTAAGCQDLGVTTPLTYRGLVDRLVALKILPAGCEEATLALVPWVTGDKEVGDLTPVLLEMLGVAVSVHGEDVDDLEESYRDILERAAALSGGAVVVTDVVLDSDHSNGTPLTFRMNGKPMSWREEHDGPDYLDQMTFVEQISELEPGGDDPRHFYGILGKEVCSDDCYLLLTDEQAAALNAEFDLSLVRV